MKKIHIKFRYVILILIEIIIIGISSNVFAFELIPELENQNIISRNATILLNVADLSEYENGINVASGKLIYDNNIFEEVSLNGTNGWTGAYNNDQSSDGFGKFILITTTKNATEEQEIAQLTLKVKDNVKNVKTKIKFESLETSYKTDTIKADDKDLELEITEDKIKLLEETKENLSKNVEKDKKTNYNMYIIITFIIIILIMFLIFIIKFKRKGGRNNG